MASDILFQCHFAEGGKMVATKNDTSVHLKAVDGKGKELADVTNTLDVTGINTKTPTLTGTVDALDMLKGDQQFSVTVVKQPNSSESSLLIYTKDNKKFQYICDPKSVNSQLENDKLTQGIYRP